MGLVELCLAPQLILSRTCHAPPSRISTASFHVSQSFFREYDIVQLCCADLTILVKGLRSYHVAIRCMSAQVRRRQQPHTQPQHLTPCCGMPHPQHHACCGGSPLHNQGQSHVESHAQEEAPSLASSPPSSPFSSPPSSPRSWTAKLDPKWEPDWVNMWYASVHST